MLKRIVISVLFDIGRCASSIFPGELNIHVRVERRRVCGFEPPPRSTAVATIRAMIFSGQFHRAPRCVLRETLCVF